MFANSEVSPQEKARFEAKAHNIVEAFIDPIQDETFFLSQLKWINKDHYQSITEERAIQKICGYPLCEKKLVDIPKKKFKICTRNNRVYDLTERKLFCSNQCYKASCFLKQQLLLTPLWTRKPENEPSFTLLRNSAELFGEEVCFGIQRITLSEFKDSAVNETSSLEQSRRTQNSRKKIPKDAPIVEQNSVENQIINSACEVCVTDNFNEFEKISDSNGKPFEGQSELIPKISNILTSSTRISHPADILKRPGGKKPSCITANSFRSIELDSKIEAIHCSTSELVSHVEKSLREWFTIDTLSCIMGIEIVKKIMLEKNKFFATKMFDESFSHLYERYAAVCKKLNILELHEERQEHNSTTYNKPTQAIPDYATLKDQTKEMEIKVRAFFHGDKKVTFVENADRNDENEIPVVLPLLHHFAKVTVRRNIVLDKLKIFLPDLTSMLGLKIIDINEKIKQIVFTCRLTAQNVLFKPLEWNLIGLILIKLLALSWQDITVRNSFQERKNLVNDILMSYQLENNYLELLCNWLVDVDHILENEGIS